MHIDDLKNVEEQCITANVPLLGREKGQWLLDFVKAKKPKQVLELGTALGYSTIILGSEGAEVTTIELDRKRAEEATPNLLKSGIKFAQLVGDANIIIKKIVRTDETFDIIFMDHRKRGYLPALDDCLQILAPGGVLIADNINMSECESYKLIVISDPRLHTEIIPIKDGLSVTRKI